MSDNFPQNQQHCLMLPSATISVFKQLYALLLWHGNTRLLKWVPFEIHDQRLFPGLQDPLRKTSFFWATATDEALRKRVVREFFFALLTFQLCQDNIDKWDVAF